MKYSIVYDKPGRIRFRCGGFAFDKSLEYSIHKLLRSSRLVIKAEVRSANGGILVYYKEGCRNEVISIVNRINPKVLVPEVPDSEYSITQIDTQFKNKLFKMVLRKLAAKLLVPMPFRKYFIVCQAIKFIFEGIKSLCKGKLTVEVPTLQSLFVFVY